MLSRSRTLQKLKPTQSDDRNAKSLYDTRAPTYDSTWHPRFAQELMTYISDPPLSPGNRCLDLCCGTGLVTFLVAQQVAPGGKVYGIDISDGMLHVAKAKQNAGDQAIDGSYKVGEQLLQELTKQERDCVTLINHDVEDLSGLQEIAGLEGTFDLVSCASGLVLLKNPREAIESWAHWLKPGAGRMILDVPHPFNLRSGVALEAAALKVEVEVPFNRSWVKSEDSIRETLEAAGTLTMDRLVFVEQQGLGTRYWNSDRETAEEKFMEIMEGDVLKVWADTLEQKTKDKLKEAFYEEWKGAANEKGKLEEIDGTWVAIATRK